MHARVGISLLLSLALVVAPMSAGEKSTAWGSVKAQGRIEVNGVAVPSETTLFVGDRVNALDKGLATVTLGGGNQVFVIENSAAQFQADAKSVTLERGTLGVLHRGGDALVVIGRGTQIRPANGKSARFLVKLEGKGFLLSSLSGDVNVAAANRTVTVPSGKTMRIELGDPPQGPSGAGASGAHAFTMQQVLIVTAVIVGTTLAIALPLALRDNTPVSPAIP